MSNRPPFKTHGKRLILPTPVRPPACKRWKPSDDPALADNLRLTDMPEEILCNAFAFLDASSLATLRGVNQLLREVASRNAAGWLTLCQRLWRDKVHVLAEAQEHTDARVAYQMSLQDAKERNHVSRDELTYCPLRQTGTIWSFRFKESAGSSWTDWDPWYRGLPCRKMVFLPDGSVKEYTTVPKPTPEAAKLHSIQAHTSGDRSDASHSGAIRDLEVEPRLSHPRFLGDLDMENNDGNTDRNGDEDDDDVVLIDPPMTMTWRFLNRPVDLPERPTGSYVRFTVGGRDVPTYCVRRSPTGNWGFVMDSCWGVYASFELPKKRAPGPRSNRPRIRRRLRRAQDAHGNWFHVAVDEIDEDDDNQVDEEEDSDRNPLADDTWFPITSGLQWREAFLYNFGARVLPEGDMSDFERGTAEAEALRI